PSPKIAKSLRRELGRDGRVSGTASHGAVCWCPLRPAARRRRPRGRPPRGGRVAGVRRRPRLRQPREPVGGGRGRRGSGGWRCGSGRERSSGALALLRQRRHAL
ncbi:unnamed protein product, partial [Prorocentrum cordatum]